MKILVFGIHPDDVELGCGGTAILAARQGHDVVIADLSEGSSSSNGTPEERVSEALEAARRMGIARRYNLKLPDTGIQSENIDQLGAVVERVRKERPSLVLLPSADDPHPDHASGGRLIERALYLSGVHGYSSAVTAWRVPRALVYPGRRDFEPEIVVDVTSTHDAKLEAILAHVSQFVSGAERMPTPLNSPDFIDMVVARARVHGHRVGVRFGEPFRTMGPIKLVDLKSLEG